MVKKSIRGKFNTLVIAKTKNNKIFGAFTDLAWSTDWEERKGNGNSLVFKVDGTKFIVFKHIG